MLKFEYKTEDDEEINAKNNGNKMREKQKKNREKKDGRKKLKIIYINVI